MIDRLYLDNVRSFVNFEWEPGRLALLLGGNGSGKTALFETLESFRHFVTGQASASESFPETSRTRWDTRSEQKLQLDVTLGAKAFQYRLVLDQDGTDGPMVAHEYLRCDGQPLVEFNRGELRTFRGGSAAPAASAKSTRSGLGALAAGGDPDLETFQKWVRNIWLLRPNPRAMSSSVDRRRSKNAPWLASDMSNFAAWYPPTLATKPGSMFKAMKALEPVLEGFTELYDDGGTLSARFDNQGQSSSYAFDELSDGERLLITLYVVLHGIAGPGKTLLLDEPDNYVALREVQPWLHELVDLTLKSNGPQVFLISHHPDTLNFLAVEKGWRLFRENAGPTRIESFKAPDDMPPAQAVAQGLE